MSLIIKHFYRFGEFVLDSDQKVLLRDDKPISLTLKVFDTLMILVENSGRVVTKAEMMEWLWPDSFVEEANLTSNIQLLRKALGDNARQPVYIETLARRGYRFIAPVEEVLSDEIGMKGQVSWRVEVSESKPPESEDRLAYPIEEEIPLREVARLAEESDQKGAPAMDRQTSQPVGECSGSRHSTGAKVTDEAPASDAPLASSPADEKERDRRHLVIDRSRPRNRLTKRLQMTAISVVALTLAGLIYVKFFRGSPSPAEGEIKSLAVLPLENLSGDPSQEYFADGMTDALIGDLAKIRGLQVISRTSAMHYKGAKKSLPEIASELKVDAVIEGTVQRAGDRIRISAQLIRAATDRHIWAETYERDVRDVLALQSEIAQAVAREVQIKLMPADRARLTTNRPVNRKAYDDYLQGRFLYWNNYSKEGISRAISFFQSAINEDPTYAPAYAGLADCYNAQGTVMIGAMVPMEARRRAEEAATKALETDDEMAEAHVALGNAKHFNWDWAAAEQEFRRAIELNPNYAYAYNMYATSLVCKGQFEEAIAATNRGQQLDPFSLALGAYRGFILVNARHFDEAIEQFRRVIAMDPNNYQAYWFLGQTYAAIGQYAEAIAASEKAVAISRTPGALGFLGMHYGFAGRRAEANKILNELLDLSRQRYVTPPAIASVYIGLGDKDQAFFWLEKAYQDRSYYMSFLKVFPGNDSLRSDPRFDDLLRRMGLHP